MSLQRFFRFYSIPTFFLLSLLALTFLLFGISYERVQDRNQQLFELRSHLALSSIQQRMTHYLQILKGAQALFMTSDSVSQAEWREYYRLLEVEKNYPGMLGMGYTRVFEAADLPALEKHVQKTGHPEFNVWPEGERALYSSILYLEPFNEMNQRAFGYDMMTEPTRQEAMLRARDTGKPALSGTVILVQEGTTDIQKGFLIYLPIYKNGQDPLTPERRKKELVGFTYSPFRTMDLMRGTLRNRFPDLDIEVYDSPQASSQSLLYDEDMHHSFEEDYPRSALYLQRLIRISGRNWMVSISPLESFGYDRGFPFWLLGGGLVISFLVFSLLLTLAKDRENTYLKQLITDNATAALFILDQSGNCTFLNPAAENLTGYQLNEVVPRNFHSLFHHHYSNGQTYAEADCPITRALKQQETLINHEDYFFRKDGQGFPVNINAQPIFSGTFGGGYLLEAQDITHQKQHEKSLQEQNKKLAILNSIGQSLAAELDLKPLLQMVTDAATDISGAKFGTFFYMQEGDGDEKMMLYTISGASKDEFSSLPHPRNTEVFGPTFRGEKIVRSDDITQDSRYGKNPPYYGLPPKHLPVRSYLAVPVIIRSGEVIGGVFLGHPDVGVFTEHSEELVRGIVSQAATAIENSRLFETINQNNAELVRTNNDLDNFVYTASHDLKSPVLNIEGLINALNSAIDHGRTERIRPIIDMMHSSVLKFKDTIQALTEVSRINKNLDDEVQLISIDEVLKDVEEHNKELIDSHQVTIERSISCPKIRFSPAYMRSILHNLLTNAIKYRHSTRKPHIHIRCKIAAGQLEMRFTDNGMGIPESQKEKVFQLFKRYHAHVEGTGVGLYLVKRILENNGGSIQLDSKEGEGTTFYIRIPLHKAEPAETP